MAAPSRPKLLVLASTYPRWRGDHEPGFVHELSRRLADEFDVHVLCPHAPGALREEVIDNVCIYRFRYAPDVFETLVQGGGILSNLKRARWKWWLIPLFFLALVFTCAKKILTLRPHCIHAHWIVPQGLVIALIKQFKGGHAPPFLLTSHGGDLFALQGWLFSKLKRWVLGKANAVTVVSNPMLGEAVRLGACAAQTAVIPMGVDFQERFAMSPNIKRVDGEILFVGRLVEKKGVKYLIQALPSIRLRVATAHLIIVGSGPELNALTALVARLGLQDYVEFRGSLSQEILPELYRQAAVFVAPFIDAASGDREGLGLVTIEAIACGCPVVVGDVPVVADILLDTDEDMRAIPGSPESLAQKVSDVLVRPEVVLQRVLEVRQRLIVKYSWETVVKRYAILLKEMVAKQRT